MVYATAEQVWSAARLATAEVLYLFWPGTPLRSHLVFLPQGDAGTHAENAGSSPWAAANVLVGAFDQAGKQESEESRYTLPKEKDVVLLREDGMSSEVWAEVQQGHGVPNKERC